MIGPMLRSVCNRHGRIASMLCAVKIARATIGPYSPTVSLELLEARVLRRNPADPMTVALRACNAETAREFIAAMALLALTKAAVQDDDATAGAVLWVSGLLLEIVADDDATARKRCADFLGSLLVPDIEPEQVERAIRDFNSEVV